MGATECVVQGFGCRAVPLEAQDLGFGDVVIVRVVPKLFSCFEPSFMMVITFCGRQKTCSVMIIVSSMICQALTVAS